MLGDGIMQTKAKIINLTEKQLINSRHFKLDKDKIFILEKQ